MPEEITVTVNGEARRVPDGMRADALLRVLELDPERVVMEYNAAILSPEARALTVLKTGDTVELIQFVGGG